MTLERSVDWGDDISWLTPDGNLPDPSAEPRTMRIVPGMLETTFQEQQQPPDTLDLLIEEGESCSPDQ